MTWAMLGTLVFLSLLSLGRGGQAFAEAAFAEKIQGLDLLSGQSVTVTLKKGQLGQVVVFLSAKCPCSNSHVKILKQLAADFPEFRFVAIHSNPDEKLADAKTYFAAQKLPFTVIQDDHLKLADAFKAAKTPHAFVIDLEGKLQFKGGVTDSHEGELAHHQYLRDALNDLRGKRTVAVREARTLGCAISRASP